MKRVVWVVALLSVGLAWSAWADCGCSSESVPSCYTTFRSNQWIEFSMTVPVDFFLCHGAVETPLIAGWRVETLDGSTIRRVTFEPFVGSVSVFLWKLDDDAGSAAPEGFYRIIVETTSAGEVSSVVRVVPCYTPRSCCISCCPTFSCACGRTPPCRAAYGDAYLVLRVGETVSCCNGCGFTIFGATLWGTPAP